MTAPTYDDLFNAILAMDAYNRGYNRGLEIEGDVTGSNGADEKDEDPLGERIGNVIVTNELGDADAQGADFYAIAYEVDGGSGETVISYRGTDDGLLFGADVPAWATGAGVYSTPQTILAAEFYQDVNGGSIAADDSITLTGHSLGGGLAGFVGSIYGVDAVMFDHMPYEDAAENLYNTVTEPLVVDPVTGEQLSGDTAALSRFYLNQTPPPLDSAGTRSGYAVRGESLEAFRGNQAASVSYFGDALDTGLSADQLHSQSLLVLLMYAEVNALSSSSPSGIDPEWILLENQLIPELFNEEIAQALNIEGKDNRGNKTADGKMRDMIAYSAISEGETVFGNVAVRALFDDAANVGMALAPLDAPSFLASNETRQALSQIIVQYAGLLAANKDVAGGSDALENGVMNYDDSSNLLTVSLTPDQWQFKGGGGTISWYEQGDEVTTIVGRDSLIEALVANTDAKLTLPSNLPIHKFVFKTTNDDSAWSIEPMRSGPDAVSANAYIVAVGSDGNETITGSSGNDVLVGQGGDDELIGGEGSDSLYGDDGDDYLEGGDGADQLEGGEDYDVYVVGAGDTVVDSDGEGHILYNGRKLTGGQEVDTGEDESASSNRSESDKIYKDDAGNEYSVDGTYLNIKLIDGGSLKVRDWSQGELEIELIGKDDPGEAGNGPFGMPVLMLSPLVLDLDDDGLEITSINDAPVYFDIDADGARERVAWASADDGILVLDRNGNGKIDDATEWFGYAEAINRFSETSIPPDDTVPSIEETWTSGFDLLAELDDNNDGKINDIDVAFANLKVWRDFNQNGISGSGELFSLEELNISQLSTVHTFDPTPLGDNLVSDFGTYTKVGGEIREMSDVWFRFNSVDNKFNLPTLSAQILNLPELKTGGAVESLRHAMHENPELEALVAEAVTTTVQDVHLLSARMESIIMEWHGVSNVWQVPFLNFFSEKNYFDYQHLAVLEQLSDTTYTGPETLPVPGARLEREYHLYLQNQMTKFFLQTDVAQVLLPEMSLAQGDFVFLDDGVESDQILARFAANEPVGYLEKIKYWNVAINVIDSVYKSFIDVKKAVYPREYFIDKVDDLLQSQNINLSYDEILYARVGEGGGDTIVTPSFTDRLWLNAWDVMFAGVVIGGDGDDRIELGDGDQVVVFGAGQGNDRVMFNYHDAAGFTVNREVTVFLADLMPSEVTFSVDATTDILVTVVATGETLRLMDAVTPAGLIPIKLEFGNGQQDYISDHLGQWIGAGLPTSSDDTIVGSDYGELIFGAVGNDALSGMGGDDVLHGGVGDDTLDGGRHHDRYIYALGDGNDTIIDLTTKVDLIEDLNTLEFLDLNASDVSLSYGSNGNDLLITLTDGAVITVANQFLDAEVNVINAFEFVDGTVWNEGAIRANISGLTVTHLGTSGDDILRGANRADSVLDGGDGNDVLTARGEDVLFGGSGNDLFEVGRSTYVDGGTGFDVADFSTVGTDGWQIDLSAGEYSRLIPSARPIIGSLINVESVVGGRQNDVIFGSSSTDAIDGNKGDDYIRAGDGNDTLIGGEGNDRLVGNAGSDTYIYSFGDGSDTINDGGSDAGSIDQLVFDSSIATSDVAVSYSSDNRSFALSIQGTNDSIVLEDMAISASGGVDEVVFADGTVWDLANLESLAPGNPTNTAPVAVADSGFSAETDTPLILNATSLLANDTDADNDTLTIQSVQDAVNGTVGLDSNGNVEFTPAAGYAGPASFTYTVSDGNGGVSTAQVDLVVEDPTPVPVVLERRIASSADDVEEDSSGVVDLDSSDIELVDDGDWNGPDQTIGLRFTNLDIPQGAVITSAWLQFQVDEVDSGATSLEIRAQNADDAGQFTTATNDVSSRPTTAASVAWQPAAWTVVGEAGADQRTPDLKSLVQEIVDRQGWTSNNDLAFIITGTGERTAESYDNNASAATLLHVEYHVPPAVNVAPVAVADDGFSVETDTPLTIVASSLLANDTDANNDVLTLQSVQGAVNGSAVLDSNGDVLFTPQAGYTGPASFTYTVSDGNGGVSTAQVDLIIEDPTPVPVVLERRIASSADDVEEDSSGVVDLDSGDIELVDDNTWNGPDQTVGLRFTNLDIPQGAVITSAWLQFQVDEVDSSISSLEIRAQDVDDAGQFTSVANDVSSRATTSSSVAWQPAAWTVVGEAGADQRTPDLKSLVQEIVDRQGWASNNDMAFIITGTGERTAESYDSDASAATLLHIEYHVPGNTSGATAGDDTLTGTASNDIIDGLAGNDTINGGDGDDVLIGGQGADTLNGGTGIDTASYSTATSGVYVHTGDWNQNTGDAAGDTYNSIEVIVGSAFDDSIISDAPVLNGGAGNDYIYVFGGGNVTIDGGAGNDTIDADDGADVLNGGSGDDSVIGYGGDDQITLGDGDDYSAAGDGNDTIDGGAGADEIRAGSGNDTLIGGDGNDSLHGDDGDDIIDFGLGDDYAAGGAGNDTFIFRSGYGYDEIGGFESGAGVGDVVEIDAALAADYTALQAFMTDFGGPHTFIEFGNGDTLRLYDTTVADLHADDFRFVA
jgi:Ca2+-binding RTX toxin-like protein